MASFEILLRKVSNWSNMLMEPRLDIELLVHVALIFGPVGILVPWANLRSPGMRGVGPGCYRSGCICLDVCCLAGEGFSFKTT